MPGFIRRFSTNPGLGVIEQIEGVTILDLSPPGFVTGVGEGVVAMVGEFQDMTFGVAVSASGVVTTNAQPTENFGTTDFQNKFGGFDELIGDFGGGCGNAFAALRNKPFARLICVPINLASSNGTRLTRNLPSCTSLTNPNPVVLLQAAVVPAGYEFKTSGDRVRSGARRAFTALGSYATGVDGAVTAAGSPAATQVFGSAGATFLSANGGVGVKKGDILQLGIIGTGSGGTYRVEADASSDTQLTVEKLDGSNFDWTTATAQPYRLHPSTDADTGGANAAGDTGGYLIPSRPLDATISAGTAIAPTTAPAAATATTWDPLSGLQMLIMPGGGGSLVYTAGVQAPNAVNASAIDALYQAAISSLLALNLPQKEVNIVISARHSQVINAALNSHVQQASAQGVGRTTCISPKINTLSEATVLGGSDPGVGANRNERVDYAWPGIQTSVPEAVGFTNIKGADGTFVSTGILDTTADAWLASILSLLAPERNPAQGSQPVPTVMASALGFQRGVGPFEMTDYILFRQNGVVAFIIDEDTGPGFQSGVTTSLVPGQKNIARRRMADFIEDSLAKALKPFAKEPLTLALMDSETGEVDAFLGQLLSANNPPQQRIAAYSIDDKGGNTADTLAQGVFTIIVNVQTLASQDFIVIQATIGEGVVTTTSS